MNSHDIRTAQMSLAAHASETGLHRMLEGLAEAYAESEDHSEQVSIRAQFDATLAIGRFRFEGFDANRTERAA